MASFNRTKHRVLKLIKALGRPITASDIEANLDLTRNNAAQRLWDMWKKRYLRHKGRGKYALAAKGERILTKLNKRAEIERKVGVELSYNLRRPVPFEVQMRYTQITGKTVFSF